ncbi:S26 family signal peptidase [Haloarchaeobius sp. DFWS5]|uniref:S26 family signal peptidase n=1 Tax=Haloarchaeobius sp. DFWS5 TaxID=3446114 RepID=UPI003EB717C5
MTGPGTDDEPDDHRGDRDDAAADESTDATDEWEWVDETSTERSEHEPDEPGDRTDANDERAAGADEPAATAPNSDTEETVVAGEKDGNRLVDPNPDATAPEPAGPSDDESFDGPVDWFFNTNNVWIQTTRDIGGSLLTVAVIGLVLFGVSGVWPPLVAVESGSMEPHMYKNDLVFIVDDQRYPGNGAVEGTGVVTHRIGEQDTGYWSFGDYGNVIIYQPYGDERATPIIHRAMFYVEEGENWYDKANESYLNSGASSCEAIANGACPAPHAGFITKGDNNPTYDQVATQSNIVRPDWVRGKAKVRIPWLGWIRLKFAQLSTGAAAASTNPLVAGFRLSLGLSLAGVGAVVSRREGWL